MRVLICLLLASAAITMHAGPMREVTYNVVTLGGQVVPRYDNGYLIYLPHTGQLEVYAPDGQIAIHKQLTCPGASSCSALGGTADSRGNIAVAIGYLGPQGRVNGIRILDSRGVDVRFLDTSPYVPMMLAFDANDDLWSVGWQRDPSNPDFEEAQDYLLVRKFSADGKELGRFLPRSLWPQKNAKPGMGSGGYWRMSAAKDRIGAVIHENYADHAPEWVEWSLDGKFLSRTTLPKNIGGGRAFTGDGRLFVRFVLKDGPHYELRVLDPATGAWTATPSNLPVTPESDTAFLLGADGNDLVYRIGRGNVRLLTVPVEER